MYTNVKLLCSTPEAEHHTVLLKKKKKKNRKKIKPEPSGNSWESTVPQNLPPLMPGGWASITARVNHCVVAAWTLLEGRKFSKSSYVKAHSSKDHRCVLAAPHTAKWKMGTVA